MLNNPRDFVGNILAMMLSEHLKDPENAKKIQNWRMIVLLRTNFYPISITFENGVTISRDLVEHPTLEIVMSFDTMIELVRGKTSMVKEVIRRQIQIKGLLRHPIATMRFYRLMQVILGG